jgi:CDP-diacylglycerol--glycerol-3-phosphate 3-phosphatidyltransferase
VRSSASPGLCWADRRRLEGPFGKIDRTLALGATGGWICFGSLPAHAALLMPAFALLLLVTIVNRVRFAAAEACIRRLGSEQQ